MYKQIKHTGSDPLHMLVQMQRIRKKLVHVNSDCIFKTIYTFKYLVMKVLVLLWYLLVLVPFRCLSEGEIGWHYHLCSERSVLVSSVLVSSLLVFSIPLQIGTDYQYYCMMHVPYFLDQ